MNQGHEEWAPCSTRPGQYNKCHIELSGSVDETKQPHEIALEPKVHIPMQTTPKIISANDLIAQKLQKLIGKSVSLNVISTKDDQDWIVIIGSPKDENEVLLIALKHPITTLSMKAILKTVLWP